MALFIKLVLVALLPLLISGAPGKLPNAAEDNDSIIYLTTVTGKSFFVSTRTYGNKTRDEAAAFCRRFNMRLASIRSNDEIRALENARNPDRPRFYGVYWVAAQDERQFSWPDFDEPVKGQFDWNLIIPFNTTCLFVEAYTGHPFTLRDRQCSHKGPGVLCETPN